MFILLQPFDVIPSDLMDKPMFNPNAPQSPYYITTWRNNDVASVTFSRFFCPLSNNFLSIFCTCVICIVFICFDICVIILKVYFSYGVVPNRRPLFAVM